MKNNEVLKESGGAKVLVCSGGEVDAASSSFVDADGGKILTVDHIKVRSSAAHIRTHARTHAHTHTNHPCPDVHTTSSGGREKGSE